MSVEEQISELVDKYEGLDARRLKQFNEENTKKDFILPLFRHLGWDVTNSDEVAAEEKSSNGRVDYAFKIGGVSKFYLEAKPLREDLNQRPDWAKQVITYAENKGVTWAVLTNFKQLVVFNAEWDEPALERARFLNLTYREYLPAFHKLWWLSRDSVEKGMLDEEARQVGALKPKLPVEKSLLDQLLRWRGELFNQIYQHNKDRGLDLYQVDELIQQFINRLIFIRSTEDRGIEENRLRAALHQWRDSERKGELVERMRAIFHEFTKLYDSDLFPPLDTWDSLFVESDTIEKIIEGSYERPTRLAGYDFAAIDADVLGAVYEQYLGYVAQVAREEAKRRATQARLLGFEAPTFELEARRIKRKQQGIYYTPKFVVDYIVRETVGRFIKEHSHNDIFNIKILDPACGSGSFLVRAYDELLHYHARQQGKSPAELDHWERLSILNRNIFGVDLDRQAVEITRLSLLLRSLSKREILPGLAENIRQGNSLISGTEEELRHYFGDNWEEKKPFNWEGKFPDIMKDGGFDVVIGNPPYVAYYSRGSEEIEEEHKRYFVDTFGGEIGGSQNTFLQFIAQGLHVLRDGGLISYIVPDTLMVNERYQLPRRRLITDAIPLRIVQTKFPVFPQSVRSCIFVIRNEQAPDYICSLSFAYSEEELNRNRFSEEFAMRPQDFLTNPACYFLPKPSILSGIKGTIPLSEICKVKDGINPGMSSFGLRSRLFLDREAGNNPKKLVEGKNISRYNLEWSGMWVDYDKNLVTQEAKTGGASLRDETIFAQPKKLVSRQTADRLIFALDDEQFYTTNSSHNTFLLSSSPYALEYVLGILNSKFMSYVYRGLSGETRDVFPQVHISMLKRLPVRSIDFGNPKDKKTHDDLVALVERMLELNKRLAPIRNTSSGEREELLREIERTDAEIDQRVYELYGLTEKKRQIIEASLVSKS